MTATSVPRHHASAGSGRPWRWSLVVVLLIVAANAVYGGVGLMVNGLGMPQDWLARTPFGTWTWPGVALLVTVAAPQLLAAALVLVSDRRAALVALVVGAGLVLWIVVQLLVLRRYFFLQPVIAGLGGLEMLLAWAWSRHRGAPGGGGVDG